MSALSYLTTCQLCGKQFTHAPLAELGSANPHLAAKVVNGLAEHIVKEHPKEDASAQIIAQIFLGVLRFKHFSSQDESAMQIRDAQRHQIFQIVKKVHVPDNKIVEQVTALGLPDEYVHRVIACVRLMRDIIEEQGQFQPKMPEVKSALVS